ncbi:MAG: DNA topoisomerase 3 [Myxococcota bacterium]
MKRLVITEKPSVARDIVAALGGFTEEEGYWESQDFVVTFAVGHLFELFEPEDLDEKYKRWTLDTLPIIPDAFQLKPKREHSDRLKTIKSLIKREDIQGVVNACDAGREGELIFREIFDFNEVKLPIERLWLQSMTKDAIKSGFSDLKPGDQYKGLRDAAYCRTQSDWLIGMNATRALTRRLKTRGENQAWSAGRVQTPTLAMLVEREMLTLAHKPEPFWRLLGTFEHGGVQYAGTWFDENKKESENEDGQDKPDRMFDEARAQKLLEKVQGKPALASETRKPSREAAPPLFDLTSLQREANRKFGWSARRTLNAAQRCYEAHKTLTYPRSDSRALPEDYKPVVTEVIEKLGMDVRYAASSQYLKKNGRLNEDKIFDDKKVSDHFAIVPTGVVPETPLEGDDGRLFDLVVRRFLSAFHPPATWSRVERITRVDDEAFRSRARTLQEPGWRAVMGETEVEEGDAALPPLVPGADTADGVGVKPETYTLEKDETKPPARISEGRLLSLMENAGEQVEDEEAAEAMKDKGIGTPATRADIIENLIRKGYVVRAGKVLRPSVKGIRLIDVLRRMKEERLASPSLTGEMEQHLLEVEKKKRKAEVFMDEIRDYTREIVERTKGFEFDELFPDTNPLGKCPGCGRTVYERSWFYRCKETAEVAAQREAERKGTAEKGSGKAEDCPFRIWKDKSGRYIDRTTAIELLETGKTRVLDGFTTRQGRTYRGTLAIENGEIVLHSAPGGDDEGGSAEAPEYEVDDTPLGPCPVCTDGQVTETRQTFVCSKGRAVLKAISRDEASIFAVKKKEIPEGMEYCGFVLPRTVCKREITRDEAMQYLRDKKTPLLTDFISQRGRPFSATLVLREETGRHGFEFPPRGKKGEGEEGSAAEGSEKKPKPEKKGKKAAAEPKAAKASKKAPAKKGKKSIPAEASDKPEKAAKASKAPKASKATPAKKAAPAKAKKKAAKKTSVRPSPP